MCIFSVHVNILSMISLLATLFCYPFLSHGVQPTNDNYFEFASFIVTQYSLDNAPALYATFLDQAMAILSNITFPNASYSYDSALDFYSYSYAFYGSLVEKNFTLDEDSLNITIEDYGVYIYAQFGMTALIPVYVEGCGVWVFCYSTSCIGDDLLKISGPIISETRIYVNWTNSSSSQSSSSTDTNSNSNSSSSSSSTSNDNYNNYQVNLKANVSINTTNVNYDIGSCDVSGIVGILLEWFGDISSLIQTIVQEEIDAEIASAQEKVNVPQSFSPYTGVNITYQITSMEFAARNYFKFVSRGLLAVQNQSYVKKKQTNTDTKIENEKFLFSALFSVLFCCCCFFTSSFFFF